ncbi:MAG: deaminase [Acidobacteriota bacterium]
MIVVGLTGRNGAGKGEIAAFLARKGFQLYSLSDVVREEVAAAGLPETRENLIAMGRELREKHGAQVLAERVCKRLQPDKNYCVDSIRNPAEAEFLRRACDFLLLFVDAPVDVRFARLRKRGREGDPESFKRFLALEKQELESDTAAGQQLMKCEETADFKITNDSGLDDLHRRVADIVLPFLRSQSRPSWDAYFMDIARMVAMRSNCLKRKVAAVIAKDRRIISTGYNGTPRGIRNCNEGGCPRCNQFADSGSGLEECYCSHGEENAIVQAAYHGVCIAGGTLYSTHAPCLLCTKMIINSGIVEVVYSDEYPLNAAAFQLLREAGIQLRKFERDSQTR